MGPGALNKLVLGLLVLLGSASAGRADIRSEQLAGKANRADNAVWQLIFGQHVVKEAQKQLGKPYIWGAKDGDRGFDCSGLTAYVYGTLGVSLAPNALGQYQQGIAIERFGLQPGDLVFFTGQGSPLHVGIFTGQGHFLHAPGSGKLIQESSLDESYFKSRFIGARRIAPDLSETRKKRDGVPAAIAVKNPKQETPTPQKEKAP